MLTFKLILIFSLQVLGLFGLKFRDSGAKYLQEKFQRAAAHLNISTVQESWIQQPLDHLSANDTRTWKMRYFSKMDLYKPGGPIILYIQGESEATSDSLEAGAALELANLTGGALISSEHRYYGKSKPLSINRTEDFKYLSSVQAMGDLVNLIKHIKNSIKAPNAKVVAIGGAYAGNLATWMRLKYPELVHAAYASSAPVLAKKNFFEYHQKVGEEYTKYGGEACYTKIQNQLKGYLKLFKTKEGMEQLKKDENICPNSDMTKIENQQLFVHGYIENYDINAQYFGPSIIQFFCTLGSLLKSKEKCQDCDCMNVDFNKEYRKSYDPWHYQMCTEFGYFQTSVPPFTSILDVDYFVKICMLRFGAEFNEKRVDEGVAKTNEMFGGRNPKVTRVVFTNSDLDAWSTLGVLQSLSAEAPAIVMSGELNSADLFGDSPQSIKVQKDALSMIQKWLKM